jgi:hypothetical protein
MEEGNEEEMHRIQSQLSLDSIAQCGQVHSAVSVKHTLGLSGRSTRVERKR